MLKKAFMRLTKTDIQNQYLRNIGKVGTTDANILADFTLNLGQRYQLVMSRMADYVTQQSYTASTVIGTQYYGYPPGTQSVDAVKVQVGSFWFPLKPIYNQGAWDALNAIPIQQSLFPQFIFAGRDDFGIWPIPQASYTISFAGFDRDRNLMVDDYTTGTVQLASGSANIIGIGTTFTPAMVGRWLEVTDTSVYGQGFWYRVGSFLSTGGMALEQPWQGNDVVRATYRIGETPEIPEEGHIILVDGVTADFYAGLRDDNTQSAWFNNKFWTGDGQNSLRVKDAEKVSGGLIGMEMRYASRDKKRLISKLPAPYSPQYKVWSQTITQT